MISIIQSNNQAAALMHQGQYTEAIAYAKNGITQLRDAVFRQEETWKTSKRFATPLISMISIEETKSTLKLASKSDSDNTFSAYKRAMFFPDEHLCVAQYQREVAAVLLFNLAMSKHMLGTQGAGSSKHLEGALQVYKLSLSALQQASSPIAGPLALLMLGNFANIGHIQSHFWRKQEAEECLDHIHHLLPHATDADMQEQEFFVVALMTGRLCRSDMAPAA